MDIRLDGCMDGMDVWMDVWLWMEDGMLYMYVNNIHIHMYNYSAKRYQSDSTHTAIYYSGLSHIYKYFVVVGSTFVNMFGLV